LTCTRGVCIFECTVAADCNVGQCCATNHCSSGAVCFGFPDGGPFVGPDGGPGCTTSAQCNDGQFCNGIERCVAGRCVPDDYGACDDGNPCTQDLCNETQASCSHSNPTGMVDADHDGHYPPACGGPNADDCNDNDPTVYWNALELCDLKDNNC